MDELGVWTDLVGQSRVVKTLQRAVTGERHAMTHAWLFTGPPGSGRSNAARAFAAALQCPGGGCGHCNECRIALSGAHPDVTLVRTEQLSIGVDEVREIIRRAAMSPMLNCWQIVVIEDADRITERGADALLKSIEEPAAKTVWLLCAPTAEDVVVTIRSRCRQVWLATPTDQAVAELLIRRDGVPNHLANEVARIAQGHIGRARHLARSEQARNWRRSILDIPQRLSSVTACLDAAGYLVKITAEEAAEVTAEADAREQAQLKTALGMGATGVKPRNTQAALKELEDRHKARAKRLQRDALDRALTELTTYFRDVLGLQLGSLDPINVDRSEEITKAAQLTTPEQTIGRIDAILATRMALNANVAPLLAMEAMCLKLRVTS